MTIDSRAESKQVTMIVSKPSREDPPIEMRQVRKIARAWGIPRKDISLRGKVHQMLDLRHVISYGAFRDKIRILYLDLDLSYLPPLAKNINKFLVEMGAAGISDGVD